MTTQNQVFTAEQTALLRKYREYVMGKAYSPEHQAEIEEVIAQIEEHMAPADLVIAMRGLYRAAHAGFAIRMIEHEAHRYIEVSKVVTSPWGLYDLGECE